LVQAGYQTAPTSIFTAGRKALHSNMKSAHAFTVSTII